MSWLPTRDEVAGWRRIPCFRSSLLNALGGGVLAGLLWGWRRGRPTAVADGLFAGAAVTGAVSWVLCRHNDRVRRDLLHRALMAQSRAPDAAQMRADGERAARDAEEAAYKKG